MNRMFSFRGLLAASVICIGVATVGTSAQAAAPGAPLRTGASNVMERLGQQTAIEPAYWVRRHGRRYWVEPRRHRRY